MIHVASVCRPCCMLLRVVAQSLKPVKGLSKQLPTFLLFRHRRSVAQQCWIRLPQLFQHWNAHVLHIVCKVLWVVSFPRCTASPNIDWSCCSHLHTILVPPEPVVSWSRGLDRYKLSRVVLETRMFAHNCQHGRNNSQHCWFSTYLNRQNWQVERVKFVKDVFTMAPNFPCPNNYLK